MCIILLYCNKRKINCGGNIDNEGFFPLEVCVLGVRGTLKLWILADLKAITFKAFGYCSSVVEGDKKKSSLEGKKNSLVSSVFCFFYLISTEN